jgi:hypothetical protein
MSPSELRIAQEKNNLSIVLTEMSSKLPWWSRGRHYRSVFIHKITGSKPTVSTNIKVNFSVQNVTIFI